MPRAVAEVPTPRPMQIVAGIAIVGALYFARDFLLPIALAILISFLLAPLVKRVERWGLSRIPAAVLVVAVAFTGLGIVSYVVVNQLYDLAYQLPDYKTNIIAKARSLRSTDGGIVARVTHAFEDVQRRLAQDTKEAIEEQIEAPEPAGVPLRPEIIERVANVDRLLRNQDRAGPNVNATDAEPEPVPVQVVEELSAREIARGVLGPLVAPLATAAVVIVFVFFMLLEREDLRDRLIRLIGSHQLSVTTQALDDAARRVSRYLLMQAIINSLYGVVIAIGLSLIGLPNAILWGILATLLRFVPYVGPWIAAVMPIVLSLAVFDGWSRPVMVIALYVVNELISNNFFEPWLYGSSTGISTLGILVSAVFWTWLWGPAGLVMATPLTVCLTVIGRHVPALAFLHTLLSDQEALPPPTHFYQRLLANDSEEAFDVAEDYLKEHSLDQLYDDVVLPALRLAEHDRHEGLLNESQQRFVLDTVRELVDDFGGGDISIAPKQKNGSAEIQGPEPAKSSSVTILCAPARDEADELVGMMLSQLLERKGLRTHVLSAGKLAGEMVDHVKDGSANVICVSALPPYAATHARYLCKRFRPKFPKLRIVVGLWQDRAVSKKAHDRLMATEIDKVVTTLAEAKEVLANYAASLDSLNANASTKNTETPEEVAATR